MLNPPGYLLSAATEAAFQKAEIVVFEHDDPDPAIFLNAPNVSLSAQVPRSSFVKAAVAWGKLRQQNATLEQRFPWSAALAIMAWTAVQNGFTRELGVEFILRARVAQAGKTPLNLESPQQGLQGFIEAPIHEQVDFLDYCSKADVPVLTDLIDMADAWRRGDDVVFDRIRHHRKVLCPQMFEAVITGRNRAWMPALLEVAKRNISTLVVVGGIHCVGESGLPEMFRKAGQSISRVG